MKRIAIKPEADSTDQMTFLMEPSSSIATRQALRVSATGNSARKSAPFLVALLMATGSVVFIEPAPYDVIAIMMFLAFFASGLRIPRELQIPLFLLGLFILGNLLATMLAADPLQSIRSLAIRVYMPMTFVVIACLIAIRPGSVLPALWLGYTIAAVIAVVWGALEYFDLLPSEAWQGGLRARGSFKDPNVYGPFLVLAAVHVVRKMGQGGPRKLGIYLSLFLVLSVGILMSFSRGAWINFAVSLGLFVFLSAMWAPSLQARMKWLIACAMLVALAACAILAALSLETIGDRFFQRAVLVQDYDISTGGRFDTQLAVLSEIAVNPVGVGPGRSDEEFGLEPHNLYLHIFIESGWLGGFAWAALILATFYRLLSMIRLPRHKLQDEAFLVTACLTGTLFQSFFIDSTHWRHLWLLLAIAWGISIARRRNAALQ